MRNKIKPQILSAITFIILGISSLPAQAYLDPGSGSLIIQSIIGALAAIGVTLKLYWHKIKLKFGRSKSSETEVNSNDVPSTKDK